MQNIKNEDRGPAQNTWMTYDETLDWIHQMEQFGIHLGLSRMENLLERMGRPDRELRIIHVAGTNGKGSVCTFISAILKAAGYSVGRYISPTLFEYRERIQVDGNAIEKEDLAKGMSIARSCCEAMASEGLEIPTIFEIETAVGFWYFLEKQCDYVVLETGMGGRLDSTNVVEHPVLSVITSISMDHMAQLGDTLSAIAAEKAGILKSGTPAVFYSQKAEAMDVLKGVCEKYGIDAVTADWNHLRMNERFLSEGETRLTATQIFDYKQYRNLTIHLAGTYQVKNACLAVEAVEALSITQITEKHIRQGLEETRWPGRFQCLAKQPLLFIDGAHNPEGAQSLRESIKTYFPDKRILLMMGVFKDKDYGEIMRIMSDVSDYLIAFTPDHPRGLVSSILCEHAKDWFKTIMDGKTAEGALNLATAEADADTVIVSFGSLSTIAGIYALVADRINKDLDYNIKEQHL